VRKNLSVVVLACAILLLAVGCKNKPPRVPAIPVGPDSVAVGYSATYTAVTTDPNGDRVQYIFDWRDGDSTVTGLVKSAVAESASHIWHSLGVYYIRVKAKDEKGLYSADWSDTLRVHVYYDSSNPPPNQPPDAPTQPVVSGPLYKDSLLTVTTSATDPDGDSVRILVSFGDPTVADTVTAMMPSGATATARVRYPSAGQKTITAWAIDAVGDTSPASTPTGVTILVPGGNHAPSTPMFVAIPAQGTANGPAYRFYVLSIDPDGDTISYRFHFGATDSMTTGFYPNQATARGTWMPTDTGSFAVRVIAIDPSGAQSGSRETTFHVVGEGQQLWAIGGEFTSSPAIGTMPSLGNTETALIIGSKSYGNDDDAIVFVDAQMGPAVRRLLDRGTLGDDVEGFSSSPAIGPAGSVYIGNDNGMLYATSALCSLKWAWPDTAPGIDLTTTPAVDDSSIYCAGDDRKLHKWTDNGATYTHNWERSLHYEASSSPVIDANGNVIVCDDSGYVYKFAADGTPAWELASGDVQGITATPAIGPDGTAYITTEAGHLLAVKDNAILWSYTAESTAITSSPIFGQDGHIYFAGEDGKLYNIDPATHTTEFGWPKVVSTYSITATPLAYQGGFYLIDDDENFFSLDLNGYVRWNLELVPPPGARRFGFGEQPSPVLDDYGIIYVATQSGLFAIAGPTTNRLLAATPWPMFHHDAHHTGKYGARR
jgi:hypothetical protein